jgi:hypothetical protein
MAESFYRGSEDLTARRGIFGRSDRGYVTELAIPRAGLRNRPALSTLTVTNREENSR